MQPILAAVRVTGVELDDSSGSFLSALYPLVLAGLAITAVCAIARRVGCCPKRAGGDSKHGGTGRWTELGELPAMRADEAVHADSDPRHCTTATRSPTRRKLAKLQPVEKRALMAGAGTTRHACDGPGVVSSKASSSTRPEVGRSTPFSESQSGADSGWSGESE